MNKTELAKVIREHKKWLLNDGGSRANLSDADLRGANLIGADLRGANLSDTILDGINWLAYIKE